MSNKAPTGLRNLCLVITTGCILASMSHVYVFLTSMFSPGMFMNLTLLGMVTVLIGSQAILALTTQSIIAKMPVIVILLGVIAWGFIEGVVSVPLSQVAINSNLIKATAGQTESSTESVQIRKAIDRVESRIEGLNDTLAKTPAENMQNRRAVNGDIDVEEEKLKTLRGELKNLDESSASVAFSEMMWGLGRDGLADVMSSALSIVPAVLTVMLSALAFSGRRKDRPSTPINESHKEGIGKKFQDSLRKAVG